MQRLIRVSLFAYRIFCELLNINSELLNKNTTLQPFRKKLTGSIDNSVKFHLACMGEMSQYNVKVCCNTQRTKGLMIFFFLT